MVDFRCARLSNPKFMVAFPAFCPSCGLIFTSSLINVHGTARNLTLQNNREQCPRCGTWAELPDGTFNVIGDTIEVLVASRLTMSRLRRLEDLLRAANVMPPQAAMSRLSEDEPAIAPLLQRYGPWMGKALVVILWAAIQILIAQGVAELRDDSASRADIQRAMEQAIEQSCDR